MTEARIADFFETGRALLKGYQTDMERRAGNFLSNLKFRFDIFRDTKREMDLHVASDFNVFSYIRPDEDRLSDMIAELLRPNGKHGQGDVFLKEMLNTIGKSASYDAEGVRVVREDPTTHIKKSNRSIDITIDFGKFGVGIENKPWAGEQEEQIKDYQDHLNKKYGGNFVLIFLSGDGSEPESIGEEEKRKLQQRGNLLTLSYPVEFKNWLERCCKECQAEKIRWFLRDFVEFVERNFRIRDVE